MLQVFAAGWPSSACVSLYIVGGHFRGLFLFPVAVVVENKSKLSFVEQRFDDSSGLPWFGGKQDF